MSLYHITAADLPHIGIIDPRTGSKTSTIKGYMEPRILTQTLFEYFDENSFEANKAPKVRTHSAPSSSSSYSQQPIVLDDSDDEKAEVVAVPSKKMESIDAKMMKGGDEVGLASETKSAPSIDYGPVSEEPSGTFTSLSSASFQSF